MPQPPIALTTTARPRVEELESRLAPSVTVRFDYSYDRTGYFSDPQKRAALQRAADAIGPVLQNDLAAIAPSGTNTWQATFYEPATNSTDTVVNPAVGENEVVVYVAAAPLGSSELGLATTGGFSASGSRAWLDTVRGRGQAGALANPQTAYSTWGGMITFDSRANFNFGTGNPTASQYDFTSVAVHELMHVFGFGLGEPAFTRNVANWNGSTGQFVGPNVEAVAGGPVGVTGDGGDGPDHWAPGTKAPDGSPSPMQPSLMAGEKRTLTRLDYAALADIGWQVSGVNAPTTAPAVPPPAAPPPVSVPPPPTVPFTTPGTDPGSSPIVGGALPTGRLAVGTPAGVSLFGPVGEPLATVDPFGGASPGGVRVASADVTGDGVPDLIVGTGPGRPAVVEVLDGQTHLELVSFSPFEAGFTGGVFVAAGDFNGDGKAEVVVTPDLSGGPVVVVYDGQAAAGGQVKELTRFLGLADPTFRGGARAAVGDVNGDHTPDLVVSAGMGGGPRVAVFDGRSVPAGGTPATLVADFFAFEPGLRNGAFVAAADLDGDGCAEVICGAGPGGAPRVIAFNGRQLLAGQRAAVANFYAGDPNNRSGVRVAAPDLDGDGRPDLVTGAGQGGAVNVYAARDLSSGSTPPAWVTETISGDLPDGVYVG